jgi:SAM-dependent methyltransferase
VEPVKSAAIEAASKLDRVVEGMFNPDANLPTGYFDCVLFNDVLEHLLDPKSALQLARTLLRQGGVVVASIPNIRHFQTQWRLLLHGEWVYRDSGTLDRTHLRFFTCKSIAPLFIESGYDVKQLQGINPFWSSCLAESSNWRYFKILNLLTFGGIEDMKYLQFAVVARPRS